MKSLHSNGGACYSRSLAGGSLVILLGRRSSMLVGAGYVGTGGVVPVWVGTGVAGTVVLGTVLGVAGSLECTAVDKAEPCPEARSGCVHLPSHLCHPSCWLYWIHVLCVVMCSQFIICWVWGVVVYSMCVYVVCGDTFSALYLA